MRACMRVCLGLGGMDSRLVCRIVGLVGLGVGWEGVKDTPYYSCTNGGGE